MVNYMNMEIERVQQDLISIKNIRKIQEKGKTLQTQRSAKTSITWI